MFSKILEPYLSCSQIFNAVDEALQLYNENTVARGQQLYQRSREAAACFAPEGRSFASPKALLQRMEHSGQACITL